MARHTTGPTGAQVAFTNAAATMGPRALMLALLLGAAAPALSQRSFYVDFSNGNDAADGITPATAWKRSPGDPQATGTAARTRLAAGDRVLFRGGVRYRGTITVTASGTAERPIVFDGSAWGDRRAIIDGSNMLAAPRPCASQVECLGAANWRQLQWVPVEPTAKWSDWLFNGDHPMQMAQWPAVRDYWDYDDSPQMQAVPRARLADVRAGFLPVPVPTRLAGGSPVLALFHNTNDIEHSTNFRIMKDGVRFTQAAFRPMTNQDNRFSIVNSPSEVDEPGKFAISPKDGRAIYWPREGSVATQMSIGSRRLGFTVRTVRHVAIRGFSFTNFASDSREGSYDRLSGVPVYGLNPTTDLRIEDNHFRSIVNHTRAGAIRVLRGSDLVIRRNHFNWMPWSTAIHVTNNPGKALIACNRIDRIGRNGIRLLNNMETTITGNRISNLEGMHGSGVNIYLDNRIVRMTNNVITLSRRPLAMHGAEGSAVYHDDDDTAVSILISGNTLIANLPDRPQDSAISSWGKGLRNVTLEGNFLSGRAASVRFNGDERNVTMRGNQLVGQVVVRDGQDPVAMEGNMMLDPQGNGAVATEEAARRWPSSRYCS